MRHEIYRVQSARCKTLILIQTLLFAQRERPWKFTSQALWKESVKVKKLPSEVSPTIWAQWLLFSITPKRNFKSTKLPSEHWVTRPKISSRPIPRLFFETKIFETETFFRDQIFLRLIPRLFFKTKCFWNRYRDFFSRPNFLRQLPRLF